MLHRSPPGSSAVSASSAAEFPREGRTPLCSTNEIWVPNATLKRATGCFENSSRGVFVVHKARDKCAIGQRLRGWH